MARAPRVEEVEELPEADRLAPYPHPRHTRDVVGHGAALGLFGRALTDGRLHHAWLLTGPTGIGKATVAWRVARFAIAEPAERRDPDTLAVAPDGVAARQVAALSHPGLMLIRRPYDAKEKRFKTVITVDEVRRLKSFLTHTGVGSGWRVVIVDPIEDMNVSAANALLKTLEEPPPKTLFLLVCAEPGRLLPTIRSRCRTLPLAPLARADLLTATSAAIAAREHGEGAPAGDVAALADRAHGSVARLLTLAGAGATMLAAVDAIFDRLPAVDWTAAHVLADDLGASDGAERADLFTKLLLERMSDAARQACGAPVATPVGGAAAGRLADAAVLASWAELWETVVRDKTAVDTFNLDRRSFVLGTLTKLAQALSP